MTLRGFGRNVHADKSTAGFRHGVIEVHVCTKRRSRNGASMPGRARSIEDSASTPRFERKHERREVVGVNEAAAVEVCVINARLES